MGTIFSTDTYRIRLGTSTRAKPHPLPRHTRELFYHKSRPREREFGTGMGRSTKGLYGCKGMFPIQPRRERLVGKCRTARLEYGRLHPKLLQSSQHVRHLLSPLRYRPAD